MRNDPFDMKVLGDRDVIDILENIAPREANNLIRSTVHGVAGQVRDKARADMPVDSGDLRRNTKTKRKRMRRGFARSDVIVQVGTGGAWYWRLLEYGTRYISELAIFRRAAEAIRPRLVVIFRVEFGRKLEAVLKRKAKNRVL